MTKKKSDMSFAEIKAKLNKEREGSVISASEFESPGFISTGIDALDEILGGGFAKGRIVDLYGKEAAGKCLAGDTLITTPFGFMTIEEIFNLHNLPLYEEGVETEISMPLYDASHTENLTASATSQGYKDVVEVTTMSGRKIVCTPDHKFWVASVDENDEIVGEWVAAEDLKTNDALQRHNIHAIFKQQALSPYSFTGDQAYVLGVLTAHGYIDAYGKPQLIDSLVKPASDLEKYFVDENNDGMSLIPEHDVDIPEPLQLGKLVDVSQLYIPLGGYFPPLKDRTIPLNMRISKTATLELYLRGLIESSAVFTDTEMHIEFESPQLAQQVQVILDSYTLQSTIREVDLIKGEGFIKHTVVLDKKTTASYHLYFEPVDPTFAGKIEEFIEGVELDAKRNVLSVDYVKEVKPLEEKVLTYDFTMAGEPEFVANGIRTHNSGTAMSFAAQAQKEGIVVYINIEDAYSPELATICGVDTDALELFEMGTAEDVLETVRDLIKTGEVSAVIIDSLTGLTPRALTNGEIGDAHVGVVARLTSDGMKLFINEIRESGADTVIVLINQIRDIISRGGMGPTSQATGGRAVKFYASTRINVSKVETLKNSSGPIGHKVKYKLDKSRLSKPLQEATVEVYYGVGFSNAEALMSKGQNLGLISKSGSWFVDTSTGEKLANGIAAMSAYLKENPDYEQELRNRIAELS